MSTPEPPPVQRPYVEPPPVQSRRAVEPPPIVEHGSANGLGNQFRDAFHGETGRPGRPMTRAGMLLRVAAGVYAALFLVMLLSGVASVVENESGSMGDEAARSLFLLVVGPPIGTAFLGLYATPSILAYLRNHPNAIPLAIINAAFGWTMLGWIGCLAWSFSADVTASRPVVGRLVPPGE